MGTPDGSTTNASEQPDGKELSAKTNVLNSGLGREFNITVIAALLSLVVALVTVNHYQSNRCGKYAKGAATGPGADSNHQA